MLSVNNSVTRLGLGGSQSKNSVRVLLSRVSSVSAVPLVGRFIVEQAQDRRVNHILLEIRTGRLAYQFFSAVLASLDMSVAPW